MLEYLPVALSVATIPVAYLLFRRLLETEFRAQVATAAFAIMPSGYEYMIAGGGVTRAAGLLAAVATLVVAIDLFRRGGWRRMAATGILLAATALSHPQAGVFAALSLVFLALAFSPVKRLGLARLIGAGAIGAVLITPWLFVVINRHGLETVVGAAQTGTSPTEGLVLLAGLHLSGGLFEVLGILGAFGLFVAVLNRRWLLPVWLLATLVVGSRAGTSYGAVILSAGVALAVADGLRFMRRVEPDDSKRISLAPVAWGVLLVVGLLAVADSAGSGLRPLSPLHGLDADTRDALSWIQDETPSDSVILVASGTAWFIDAASEWLPALTGRRSSATVQGSEWLGPGAFKRHEDRYVWLQSCFVAGRSDCLDQWESTVEPVDYLLALKSRVAQSQGQDCCLAFARQESDRGGSIVFENEGALIVAMPGD